MRLLGVYMVCMSAAEVSMNMTGIGPVSYMLYAEVNIGEEEAPVKMMVSTELGESLVMWVHCGDCHGAVFDVSHSFHNQSLYTDDSFFFPFGYISGWQSTDRISLLNHSFPYPFTLVTHTDYGSSHFDIEGALVLSTPGSKLL